MSVSESILSPDHDVRTIGLVSGAHGISHFYQLVLPPLFPILHFEEGYSFTELGLLIAIFYLVSGVVQPLAGFLVDRIGPRSVLYFGIALASLACSAYALADNLNAFIVLVIVAGVGNGVFHPADYTVLSHNVSERRVGKGFSFHAFGGYIGYAIAPVVMVTLASLFGWRGALLAAGFVGFAFLVLLISTGHRLVQVGTDTAGTTPRAMKDHAALLLSPVVIGCFLFFCVAAMAQIGLQTFAPSALLKLFETEITVSNIGVTAFLVAVTSGILSGGVLADRTQRHHLVTVLCLIPPAAMTLLPAWFDLSHLSMWTVLAIIGFFFGLLIPSRDMLVRAAAPRHSSGKVFGVVYSGLDVGSALTPIAFGWFLDHALAHWVFLGAAICFVAGIGAIALSRLNITTASDP